VSAVKKIIKTSFEVLLIFSMCSRSSCRHRAALDQPEQSAAIDRIARSLKAQRAGSRSLAVERRGDRGAWLCSACSACSSARVGALGDFL
jgi:hypothetical protein